jgi:hypothetical protein
VFRLALGSRELGEYVNYIIVYALVGSGHGESELRRDIGDGGSMPSVWDMPFKRRECRFQQWRDGGK